MPSKLLRGREAYVRLEKVTILILRCRMVGLLHFVVKVKVGRLKDAIREAGLTVEEFLELLK